MATTEATRSLADKLELEAEEARDQVMATFQALFWPVVTTAFRLSGEADLLIDPSDDEVWYAQAARTLSDLEHVEITLGALGAHLLRENYEVERILGERRQTDSTGPSAGEIAEMRGQVSRLLGVVEQLRGEQDGGAL